MAVAPNTAARPRSGAPYTILGLVLAVLGFGAVLLFSSMGAHPTASIGGGPQVDVVVASEDIGIRTPITASQLKVVKFAQADAPPGAYRLVDDVKNSVAAIDI